MRRFLIQLVIVITGIALVRLIWQVVARQSVTPMYPNPQMLITEPIVPAWIVRRANGELVLHWQPELTPVTIYQGTHPDKIYRRKSIAKVKNQHHLVLTDIDPDTHYYFELSSKGRVKHIVGERILPMDGIPNFRDVGGYKTVDGKQVKWGKIYRCGSLAHASQRNHEILARLDVKLVCDLRSIPETDSAPDNLPADIAYLATPVATTQQRPSAREQLQLLVFQRHKLSQNLTDAMVKMYTDILIEQNPDVLRRIFERIASEDNLPAVIHCTAGKDRTGITIALLLLWLGVDKETVIADYSLSNYSYPDFERHIANFVKRLSRFGINSQQLAPLIVADPNWLRRMIDLILGRYGTIENYLRTRVGLDDDTLNQLRENLLV